jgi:hypothetical protein
MTGPASSPLRTLERITRRKTVLIRGLPVCADSRRSGFIELG